jgi:hypothetical protein
MSKWWWEKPSPCNIERIAKQTLTHMATNDNVIPQVLQSPRSFPRRSKPETRGWNRISGFYGLTLQLQLRVKN